MGRFEDRLLDTLLREHGHKLTVAQPPAATSAEPGVRQRHWGRWVAAAGTVAAVTAGVVVVQTVPFGDRPAVSSAAAEVLTTAADRIGASDAVVGPGQYLYVESHRWDTVTRDSGDKVLIYLRESVTQTWIPHDRSQEWLQRERGTGQRKWIQGSDADLPGGAPGDGKTEESRAKCGDFHPEGGMKPCERKGTWQEPTPEFVAALPADPRKLYDELREAMADEGAGADAGILDFVQDSISRGLMPAQLRANLYRALALLPSLQVSDRNANLDGRTGVALGIETGGRKRELIIDPATGQFIGERETTTQGYGAVVPGTVTGFTALSTGVAAEMGEQPRR
ncbi:MAG: CU044_5270 family protein [Kibdelosporangium sp.]